jgi:hypothetical protein
MRPSARQRVGGIKAKFKRPLPQAKFRITLACGKQIKAVLPETA